MGGEEDGGGGSAGGDGGGAAGSLVVAKFGGSTLGVDGQYAPAVVRRISELGRGSKVLCVFSAPLVAGGAGGAARSVTDAVIGLGEEAEAGREADLSGVRAAYEAMAGHAGAGLAAECGKAIDSHLARAGRALESARQDGSFADEVRTEALAFAGELLSSNIMDCVLRGAGMRSAAVQFDSWPIVTDSNIESTNFLHSESARRTGALESLLEANDVVTIGGFVGRTADGVTTTYERGGSDRTAADLGILLHKKYDTRIDLEKDSAVVSADPKIVSEGLSDVPALSYNEARLAGMFGMKIVDPVAIREMLDNGVDMAVTITNMNDASKSTAISRAGGDGRRAGSHPLKIVTGKRNCAIFRSEADAAGRLAISLKKDRRYGEYVTLSPFTRDGVEFTRMLFLDADYMRRNEKYFLGFDPLATITYGRGVVTLIGDEMWRVQHVAARTSSSIGRAGLNILNMDAQEETSRIIVIIEDSGDNVADAIRAVHAERKGIGFV